MILSQLEVQQGYVNLACINKLSAIAFMCYCISLGLQTSTTSLYDGTWIGKFSVVTVTTVFDSI